MDRSLNGRLREIRNQARPFLSILPVWLRSYRRLARRRRRGLRSCFRDLAFSNVLCAVYAWNPRVPKKVLGTARRMARG
jgi:hypothetical protein